MSKRDCHTKCPCLKLAEAYVPWQTYTQAYKPMVALKKGTLFPELYKPYKEDKNDE